MKYTVSDPADVMLTIIPLSKHSSIPNDSGMNVTTWKLPQSNNKFSEAIGIGFDEDFNWLYINIT